MCEARVIAPQRALAQVNLEMVQEIGPRCPDQKIATVDLDATIIESWKRQAQVIYQGISGFRFAGSRIVRDRPVPEAGVSFAGELAEGPRIQGSELRLGDGKYSRNSGLPIPNFKWGNNSLNSWPAARSLP